MSMSNIKYFYSRHEVAQMLGVSFVTVDRLAKSGKLPCRHLGSRVLFTLADVQTFLKTIEPAYA